MIINSDSLKIKLKNKSKETNIAPEILLKMFMFERLLTRISFSNYRDNFIFKGGFLISSIFGVSLRSTIDMDTTIKGLSISKKNIEIIMKNIINLDINDNCRFEISSIKDIRSEDIYNGYEIILKVFLDKVWTFINIDITTGDEITYKEIEFNYSSILENKDIKIMAYNNETIIAEKFETIISRGILNTRMKDYYDLFMFVNFKFDKINIKTLNDAVNNTATRRGSLHLINNSNNIIELIENSSNIRRLWEQYQVKFEYADKIEFEDVIKAIKVINDVLNSVSV